MKNSDVIHSGEDEFASFHYSSAAKLHVVPSLWDGFPVSIIPCVRQDYQASVNNYNFNKL